MSTLLLSEVKQYLGVIHSADDEVLQQVIEASEDEACQFLNHDSLEAWVDCESSSTVSEQGLPQGVWIGVMLMIQANYKASPDDVVALRKAAEVKLTPYRCNMGI